MKVQRNSKTAHYLLLFLLSAFHCFAQENKIEGEDIQFKSVNLNFSGTIFLPAGDSKSPAVVILHGGSSNVKAHRSTSTYYAHEFVKRELLH